MTQSKERSFTWHKADPFCLSAVRLKTRHVLDDLREVEHGHCQTWVLLGELVGEGACAACKNANRLCDPTLPALTKPLESLHRKIRQDQNTV